MSRPDAVSDSSLISTARAKDGVHHALSLFVGRGRAWSCDDLATALTAAGHEIKAGAVGGWIASDPDDRRTPPTDVLLKLFQLLGPAFSNKVLGIVGQGAHALDAKPNEPGRIIADLSRGVAEFATRGADGVFCNVDQGALEPVADLIIATVQPFSSKRARPE
jgi:hypothetical protein